VIQPALDNAASAPHPSNRGATALKNFCKSLVEGGLLAAAVREVCNGTTRVGCVCFCPMGGGRFRSLLILLCTSKAAWGVFGWGFFV
jgi:hypothetical protein